MADVKDLLGLAIDSNPVSFADMLNNILQDKAMEAVSLKRIEVAQSMYDGPDETQEDEYDVPLADEDEINVDDLDLDDLDLEDLDNDGNDGEE
jgi:hypothetical protein